MDIWTIYENPKDYPGKFVARKYRVEDGIVNHTEHTYVSDSLYSIRKLIPDNLYRLHREPNDDPVIVESWI